MKKASLRFKETPPSSANNGFHSPLHYFPSVSDRWFGEGVRLLLPFRGGWVGLLGGY